MTASRPTAQVLLLTAVGAAIGLLIKALGDPGDVELLVDNIHVQGHAVRVFLRFSEDAARAEGMTPAQHQLLLAVRGHDSYPRCRSPTWPRSCSSRTTPSSAWATADDAGLTSSVADPDDARRRLVSLTGEEQSVLERLSGRHRVELRAFREEMGGLG